MQAKNIAIIIDSLAGGGAEKVMITLASALVEQGHQVTFFSLKKVAQYEIPPSISLIFPLADFKGQVRGWFNRDKLASMLKASVKNAERSHGEFDMVLVNLHESYRLASACDLKRCFYIMHSSYEQELKREKRMGPLKYLYMKQILKNLKGKDLVAVSEGVTREIEQSSVLAPKSVTCIYNPFEIEQIRQLADLPMEIEPPDKYIVHVGRAAKVKRHDVLFQALKNIQEDYKLVCLASNTRKLKKLAKKYDVENRVVLPGFTANPYTWIKRAEVLVLSSDFEGLPTVLIESIICGTKVVSTDCPHGPNEILQGDLSRYLVPRRAPEALAKTVNMAIENDMPLAKHPILDEVSAVQITQRYLDLLSLHDKH